MQRHLVISKLYDILGMNIDESTLDSVSRQQQFENVNIVKRFMMLVGFFIC